MGTDQEKQIARQRRERQLRLWLTTLSWSTPVIAFGSLFTIWHQIAETAPAIHSSPTKSLAQKPSVLQTNTSENGSTSPEKILYEIGSRGPQVSTIQQQLSLLGYFHHPITQYYGTVTAESVKTFQAEHHLPQTGAIDQNTLTAIQNVVKQVRTANLTSQPSSAPVAQSQATSGSVGLSQQSMPDATSSGS